MISYHRFRFISIVLKFLTDLSTFLLSLTDNNNNNNNRNNNKVIIPEFSTERQKGIVLARTFSEKLL